MGRIIVEGFEEYGKINLYNLDSDKYYTKFDAKFQSFSFNTTIMEIKGTGEKSEMSGNYTIELRNLQKKI